MTTTCNPTECQNGKCRATGECIDKIAMDMRALGATLPRKECCNDDLVTCTNCPNLMPALSIQFTDNDLLVESPSIAPAEYSTRQRLIEADSATRKTFPMTSGLLDYFPDALAAVANVSFHGNQKHNPGEPMHHARGKSMDHADCIMRHLTERGGFDGDIRHSAALAWRALALLQEELEKEMGLPLPRGAWAE